MDGMRKRAKAEVPSGVDVTLIEESLRRTPTERWEHHRSALALVLEIERAARAAGLRQDRQSPVSGER
jgi:hypothetical protein